MARPKRFTEKLVVGLTPEIKEFLQKEAEKGWWLIKNNGNNFNLSKEELELAELLN